MAGAGEPSGSCESYTKCTSWAFAIESILCLIDCALAVLTDKRLRINNIHFIRFIVLGLYTAKTQKTANTPTGYSKKVRKKLFLRPRNFFIARLSRCSTVLTEMPS